VFRGNKSVRSAPGRYDDAVIGNIDNTNYFIRQGKSVNSEGKELESAAVEAALK
jgi:pectate disaccharide-lyase